MKAVAGSRFLLRKAVLSFGAALSLFCSLPALAQENTPDVTATPLGTVFRWLNFLLVFGALAWLIARYGGPYFRHRAHAIAKAIGEAQQARAAAEAEFRQAGDKLASLESDIQRERREAERDSLADRERIRALAKSEVEKIGQAARAEIAAAERAGAQELRAIAARLATARAAGLIGEQLNAAAESALFDSFVEELAKAAS